MAQTTKLEAVNTMLIAIGEAPVNSLSSGLIDAETAATILEEVSREVQSKGWHFNREEDYPVAPSVDGEILLPTNTLKADSTIQNTEIDLVQRGMKMYNRAKRSFVVGTTVNLDIVFQLEFEELPEAARRYIMIRAARIFQDRIVSSDTLHGFNERDEMMALVEMLDMEGDTGDYTIFDNYSVARVLDRAPDSLRAYKWR